MKRKIVFFTGAGISAASGMPTFRGEGGIWNKIDAEKVATKKAWYCRRYADKTERRQAALDFFNPMRRKVLELRPNRAHEMIACFEEFAEVTVVTQNGDDYHERAGSTNVIYLHGEALKNCSTLHPYIPIPIDRDNPDIRIGDKAEDGSQIRPYVIFFDETLDRRIWKRAVEATKEADMFVVLQHTEHAPYVVAGAMGNLLRRNSVAFSKFVGTTEHEGRFVALSAHGNR